MNLDDAEFAKEEFREKWNKKYPNILKSWDKNWAELTVFFEYPQEIRKIIYTTNAVEGYHRMVRKFTKSKSIFPTDDAIRKVVYMSVSEISKKWTMPVRDWGLAYAQFMIYFEQICSLGSTRGSICRSTPLSLRDTSPTGGDHPEPRSLSAGRYR